MACDWYCPREHSREGLRYASDMTDREWLADSTFLSRPAKSGGTPSARPDMREVVNAFALHYCGERVVRGGMLPNAFCAGVDGSPLFYAWPATRELVFDANQNMVAGYDCADSERAAGGPRPAPE